MLASELINQLTDLIEQQGDLPIATLDSDYFQDASEVVTKSIKWGVTNQSITKPTHILIN